MTIETTRAGTYYDRNAELLNEQRFVAVLEEREAAGSIPWSPMVLAWEGEGDHHPVAAARLTLTGYERSGYYNR